MHFNLNPIRKVLKSRLEKTREEQRWHQGKRNDGMEGKLCSSNCFTLSFVVIYPSSWLCVSFNRLLLAYTLHGILATNVIGLDVIHPLGVYSIWNMTDMTASSMPGSLTSPHEEVEAEEDGMYSVEVAVPQCVGGSATVWRWQCHWALLNVSCTACRRSQEEKNMRCGSIATC